MSGPAESATRQAGGGSIPFGQYERMLAIRYLFATRKDGGVALMSIIAFVGVMLAIAALIAVMSIMNGFRNEMVTRLLGINGHIFVQSTEAMPDDEAGQVATLLREIPGVVEAYPMVIDYALAQGPSGQSMLAEVHGMPAEEVANTPFLRESLVEGGTPQFGAGENGGDIIYAGRGLAQRMGADRGGVFTLMVQTQGPFGAQSRSKPYVVGDFIDTGLPDYDQILTFMPLEQAQIFFNRRIIDGDLDIRFVDRVSVRVGNPDNMDAMRSAVQRALGPRYVVTDWRDTNAALFNALEVERGAMRLILMLVVLIAGLNIISGFTMLVRDKARDIAILRTVGVQRVSVLRVFLMSGFLLGGLGTLAGIALGVLFCIYIGPIQGAVEAVCRCEVFAADVYGLNHLPALLDWNEVIVVSLWGFFVSVFVTLIPAWFAAKVDPVEALRYE